MASVNESNKCVVCSKESTLKCSNCTQVFYCSVEHQKSDWKTHKKGCHPFLLFTNEQFGRYLVASRNIRSGEVVLKETALIRGPSQITSPVCVGCLQGLGEDLKNECERCGWPVCSSQCQDHPGHRAECDLTVARGSKVSIQHYFSPHPTYQCILTLRCMLLKETSPEKWEKLNQLESHSDERRGSEQWRSDREGIAKFIPRFFKTEKWSEEEILRVAGIVQVNGHEVPLTDPAHVAIYNYASLVEHSCKPNLSKSFSKKGEVIFWSANGITKGEHLSICYSDVLWGTASRQHHLKQTKMFKCECTRCKDVTELGTCYSALKCNRKEPECNGLALPNSLDEWEKNWKCNKCGQLMEYTAVNNILERAGKDMEAMEKGKVDNCLKYIEHYTKWLPQQHYYISDVKVALAQLIGNDGENALQAISEEHLKLKINLSRELLDLFTVIASAESRILGSLRFELHAGLAELGRRGALQLNTNFKGALEESLVNAEEAVRLLQMEPATLSEGQICAQAKVNVNSLQVMLGSMALDI